MLSKVFMGNRPTPLSLSFPANLSMHCHGVNEIHFISLNSIPYEESFFWENPLAYQRNSPNFSLTNSHSQAYIGSFS